MARWRVSEPYINLWIEDVPLSYVPARGPLISFGVAFKQRSSVPYKTNFFGIGKLWNCSWLAYVDVQPVDQAAGCFLVAGAQRATGNMNIAIHQVGMERLPALANQLCDSPAELVEVFSEREVPGAHRLTNGVLVMNVCPWV